MRQIKEDIRALKNRDLRVVLNKFLSFPKAYSMKLVFEHGRQFVHLDGGCWSDAGNVVNDKTRIDVSEAEAEVVLRVLDAAAGLGST